MPPARPTFRVRRLAWVGLAISVLGSAPLLAVIAASKIGLMHDPNPNPVGFGILTAVTLWPGLIVALVGLVLSVTDFRRARSQSDR